MDSGPRETRRGGRCLWGRNTLKLVLPSKTVLWNHSWSHGEAGETKPAGSERLSFQFSCNSCIPALPRVPTEKTLKGRTHTALLITHLMCEAIQYSHPLAFSYCSLKWNARYVLLYLYCLVLPPLLKLGGVQQSSRLHWLSVSLALF